MFPGMVTLYDVTSAPNAALDTGALGVVPADVGNAHASAGPPETAYGLYAVAITSGGTTQLTPYAVLDDATFVQRATPPAAAARQNVDWGQGVNVSTGDAASGMAVSGIVPRRVRFTAGAAGVGNTVRLVVLAKIQG